MDSTDEGEILDNIVKTAADSDNTLGNAADTDVVKYDINLVDLRGKARLSVTAPVSIATEAVDYVISEIEDQIDKRHATDQGQKIGVLRVSGDGNILGAEIDDSFRK